LSITVRLETTTDWSLRSATRTRYHSFWALHRGEVRNACGFTRARLLYSPLLLSVQAMSINNSRQSKFHAVRQFRWHPSSWLLFSHTFVRVFEISPKFMLTFHITISCKPINLRKSFGIPMTEQSTLACRHHNMTRVGMITHFPPQPLMSQRRVIN
jgi:hypothetical protein